jgi:hypothetical protein
MGGIVMAMLLKVSGAQFMPSAQEPSVHRTNGSGRLNCRRDWTMPRVRGPGSGTVDSAIDAIRADPAPLVVL